MTIQEQTSLKPYNTFGIDVKAKYFAEINHTDELFASRPSENMLVLGGGSNLLFTKDFEGLVLKNSIRGIEKLREDHDFVYVTGGGGEPWHPFVLRCIENNWAGLENLSLIPGSVGASPIQNIGAYGVEIKDVLEELVAFHLQEKKLYHFAAAECKFGYRDSIFKHLRKGEFMITRVTYRLRKNPVFNTTYGAIENELERMGVKEKSIRSISQAVINIRTSKLPDPVKIGNAGSFFKNPLVSRSKYEELKQSFPHLVGYENADGSVKLAAGWLIEHCGPSADTSWKGYRKGDAGCHPQQALVLVNYGNASGIEINALAEEILRSVGKKFGVMLEKEVNIL